MVALGTPMPMAMAFWLRPDSSRKIRCWRLNRRNLSEQTVFSQSSLPLTAQGPMLRVMVNPSSCMGSDMKNAPGRLEDRPGEIIVFATMDELRAWGPVALREWLKRCRPVGRQLGRTGAVVEFRPAHQEARACEAGS